jgi:predicted Zn finger-like uncharacterized protein
MTVHCSCCSTGYLLPDHLLGPRGVRVRCPRCANTFVVFREGATAVRPPAAALPATPPADVVAATPAAATGDSTQDAAAVARQVMAGLSARLGARLAVARAAGRVLAEFGPDLMVAFDDYRRHVGPDTSPLPFKTELRERWGIDLRSGVEN